jgi:hypothetical protein
MAIWLQIILAIVLVAVGGCLVPLLLQLRRTAASVQQLADSARQDLRQITEDVHHIRTRADGLADLAEAGLNWHVRIGNLASGALGAVEAVLGQAGPWISALLTGLRFAINLLRRPKKPAEPEETPHE